MDVEHRLELLVGLLLDHAVAGVTGIARARGVLVEIDRVGDTGDACFAHSTLLEPARQSARAMISFMISLAPP